MIGDVSRARELGYLATAEFEDILGIGRGNVEIPRLILKHRGGAGYVSRQRNAINRASTCNSVDCVGRLTAGERNQRDQGQQSDGKQQAKRCTCIVTLQETPRAFKHSHLGLLKKLL